MVITSWAFKVILSTHLINRLPQCNLTEESFADEAKSDLDAREPDDRETWKKLCTSFFKGRL
ncbi:unnamed protein product [Coffea canephora]|uniref:Uncharacterized protein n=1 Tax=Coffea canephora TaxID=49390 RepID=A0A068TTZ4_COFCA|nr:unnamed protein product [Coffea canephora]